MIEPLPPVLPDPLTRLSRTLIAQEDVDSTLTKICQLSINAIATADSADISLVLGNGKIETRGSTSALAEAVDLLQYETGEGPCLSSIDSHATFRVDDMSTESRWPRFAARAAKETKVRSMLAFVLKINDNALASLNLFSKSLRAFDVGDERIGLVFAAQAATVLANASTHASDQASIQQLQDGLHSRGVIGQAIGILQERGKLSEAEALVLLKEMSQRANVKMRDIAYDIAIKAEPTKSVRKEDQT